MRVTPKGVIARIAGVEDRTSAEALKGFALYVERARLPATERGRVLPRRPRRACAPRMREGRTIGTVVAVENYGAGDLLELRLEGKHARRS